ncbi:MAG: PIG-L deacetylase family protein [bacterium]|nr:PIG-L deacetylase family protein [bacterium]
MAIVAHPDDEAFGPGATLAHYAGRGVRVYLACATRGEAGRRRGSPPFCTPAELGAVREGELRRSARVLGVSAVFLLGLPDGEVAKADPDASARRLALVMTRTRPEVVITFGPEGSLSPHPDHVAVCHLTTRAFLSLPEAGRPARIFHYLSPWRYSPPATAGGTLVELDVSAYRARRLEALKCHLTQVQQVAWLFGPAAEVAASFPGHDRFRLAYPDRAGELDDLFDGI